jgi:holo-[acyl-carrier protein] synthase
MSVIGHGIDLVELTALRRWIEDPRDPLVPRCFTADEIAEIGEGPIGSHGLQGGSPPRRPC